MAANCGIAAGISIDCAALRVIGGLDARVWAFNIDDLQASSYTVDVNGYVTAISFETYKGLYTLEGRKKSHSAGSQLVVAGEGGNKFFQHDVTIKLFPDTPDDDDVIENLAVGNFGFIVEDSNQNFFLYGQTNGCEATEGVQNSGTTPESDVATAMTFTGEEKQRPLRVLTTDYATTLAYLESLEV